MTDTPITPAKDFKSTKKPFIVSRLNARQKELLLEMQEDKKVTLVHFTNDDRFEFKHELTLNFHRCEYATAYALILSGQLDCVNRRSYSNVWKAK